MAPGGIKTTGYCIDRLSRRQNVRRSGLQTAISMDIGTAIASLPIAPTTINDHQRTVKKT
jgi:hypothetical protein